MRSSGWRAGGPSAPPAGLPPPGLRDEGLLESALAARKNLFESEQTDIYMLAATYAFALTSNHPFFDGNKRTAFVAAGIFLELNGHQLRASEADAVYAVLALSKGELGSTDFSNWLRLSSITLDDEKDDAEC